MISLQQVLPFFGRPITECVCVAWQEVDYNLLEEKLQKTLTDLGRREKQLGEAEQEVPTTRCIICLAVLFVVCVLVSLTLFVPLRLKGYRGS